MPFFRKSSEPFLTHITIQGSNHSKFNMVSRDYEIDSIGGFRVLKDDYEKISGDANQLAFFSGNTKTVTFRKLASQTFGD